ncbi:hypothetical protein BT93_C0780 [Corymbia citriodora subsp. variegata]|nr:hypothetical protein BT93_C0780 [Corymbia citriodora subsp. variegata]KAF8034574.1 hypothetical protein BT93_C0780 [Corymbia citriodora subsp. variegata]
MFLCVTVCNEILGHHFFLCGRNPEHQLQPCNTGSPQGIGSHDSPCSVLFAVYAGLHGIHTWCKCSDVHYTQTDYCGLHNGCGVFSNRTEIFAPCCRQGCISVGIIILGAFIAGARDLSFDSYGYTVVFISNICTAVYLASIATIGKSSGLNSFGLMWCNGIICGPILLIWTSISGDLETTMKFPNLFSPGFQAVMALSCIMAFLINYCVFWNTMLNSALTQTICGNLKDLFTIGLGWLMFGGLPFDLLNVIGQSLGFLGSCLYAYCKLRGR